MTPRNHQGDRPGDCARTVGRVRAADGLVRLVEAGPHAPIDAAVSPRQMRRWATVGVRSPGGGRVRLATVVFAGRTYTTRRAIAQFVDAASSKPVSAAALAAVAAGPRRPAAETLSSHGVRIGAATGPGKGRTLDVIA